MINLSLNHERFIHGLKTALACLIGFIVTRLMGFHTDQWLIITILVVMCAQLNVGSVVHKSYLRFVGTLIGSVIAVLTIMIAGTDLVVVATVVSLSGLFFSYFASSKGDYSDAGTLGAVTTAIILIGQNATLQGAAERFIEISIGIVIAALVSRYIFPVHARRHLIVNQAKTLRQLRAYYLATLLADQQGEDSYRLLDEVIVKSLIEQRKLSVDAVHEPLKDRFNLDQFGQSLFCEKEMLRCITFMHHAYKESPIVKNSLSRMHVLQDFHEKICDVLAQLANCLDRGRMAEMKRIALPTVAAVKVAIEETVSTFSEDDKVYAYSYLFSAEILLLRLQQIILLMNQLQ